MKAALLVILFLGTYGGFMGQKIFLEKDIKCYAIRKIVPESRVDIGDVKLEKFVLYDICTPITEGALEEIFVVENGITKSVQAKLVKVFTDGLEAREFAVEHRIIDTIFAEINDCQVIRLINLPMSLMGNKVPNAKPEIALLNTCVTREKEWEVLPKIKLQRLGQEVEREFWDIRAFKDQAEAEEYAKQNSLADVNFTEDITAMPQNNPTDCHIIRVIEIPLTKKPGVVGYKKIVLLDTCLNNEFGQQLPVIEVIRNGIKEFREYEIIRLFENQKEAEKYAKDNGITDIDYKQSFSGVEVSMNETDYIFFDGSSNKYIVTEDSLEYIPTTPAQSSSLSYSGGEYVKRDLKADEYNSIVDLAARAIKNKEVQTEEKAKGNPAIVFQQKTYILKMNTELAKQLIDLLNTIKDAPYIFNDK